MSKLTYIRPKPVNTIQHNLASIATTIDQKNTKELEQARKNYRSKIKSIERLNLQKSTRDKIKNDIFQLEKCWNDLRKQKEKQLINNFQSTKSKERYNTDCSSNSKKCVPKTKIFLTTKKNSTRQSFDTCKYISKKQNINANAQKSKQKPEICSPTNKNCYAKMFRSVTSQVQQIKTKDSFTKKILEQKVSQGIKKYLNRIKTQKQDKRQKDKRQKDKRQDQKCKIELKNQKPIVKNYEIQNILFFSTKT